MQNGDLSNVTMGRAIFIWDHLLATLEHPRWYRAALATKSYRRAFECWESTAYEAQMLDYAVRSDITVDVVTHQEPLVEQITKRYENMGARVRDVFYEDEMFFIRRAAHGGYRDVLVIFFPSPSHFDLKYGRIGSPVVTKWT